MDSLESIESVCRICLDHKVILDWNDKMFELCSMSYKDCYYKYTTLEEMDSDCYPTNVCEICANQLKNSHMLFEKALNSFNFFQVAFATEELGTDYSHIQICSSQPITKSQICTFTGKNLIECSKNNNPPTVGKLLRKVEHELCLSNMYDNGSQAGTECTISYSKEMAFSIDVSKKSSVDKKTGTKRNVRKLISNTAMERKLAESCDTKLPNSSVTMKSSNDRKKYESSPDTSLENTVSECGATEPQSSLTTKSSNKSREKYLLMCAYCSLKCHGALNLKKHEAQHNENRQRTETCPQCGIKLYNKLALNNHMKIHDENRQKRYKCEFCEKAFFNRGGLNIHRRIHLGLMVTCMICSKEYYRQIDLDNHLLTHSISPIQKTPKQSKYTVQCQYCNKSVLTRKWKEHKAVHLDQPQMECTICEKKFFARSKCINHLRRFHHKSKTDYDYLINYLVESNIRMSHLMLKQQEIVQPLTE